jgi:hypothetical protein
MSARGWGGSGGGGGMVAASMGGAPCDVQRWVGEG